MKCLIIAAGQGTRLRNIAASKPLACLGGMPLIEHVLRSAREGGASEFVVVTGYEAPPLEAALHEIAARVEIPIETLRNSEWERPNGLSVLAAAERLPGEFVLLMSDHLFDPTILRDMIAARRESAALTLAADYAVDNPLLDLDDATKLKVDAEGRIRGIGKMLDRYDAIDTGIFIGTPALLDAIRESVEAGASGSLSEGVERLARDGLADAFDCGGRWWLDVDDEVAFAKAEDALARAR